MILHYPSHESTPGAPGGESPTPLAPSPSSPTEGTHESLLQLLAHCYADEVYSSEEIADAVLVDPRLRWLAGESLPDAAALRRFRRRHQGQLARSLATVLEARARAAEPALSAAVSERTAANAASIPAGEPGFSAAREARERIWRAVGRDTAALDD